LLHDVAGAVDLEAVKVLLRANATVDATTLDGSTPLHLACKRGGRTVSKMVNVS